MNNCIYLIIISSYGLKERHGKCQRDSNPMTEKNDVVCIEKKIIIDEFSLILRMSKYHVIAYIKMLIVSFQYAFLH